MKCRSWGAAAAALTAAALWACGGAAPVRQTHSRLVCTSCADGSLVDFGVVEVGASKERIVDLVAQGDAPLRIALGSSPAPFRIVSPTVPTEVQLGPGESLRLVVEFRPLEAGDAEASYPVGGSDRGGLALRIAGRARKVDIACPWSLSMGSIVMGSTVEKTVRCTNRSDLLSTTVRPVLRPSDGAFTIVGADESVTLAPGGELLLTVRYAPVKPIRYSARLSLLVDSDTSAAGVDLNGSAIASGLVVDRYPECYELIAVPGGPPAHATLHLENRGNVDVAFSAPEITPAVSPFRMDPAGPFVLSAAGPGTAGGSVDLDLSFAPPALGAWQAAVRLTSDDRVHPAIELCVRGVGKGFEMQPDALDFGVVDVGETRRLPSYFVNVDAPSCCAVSGARIEGSDAGAFELGPGLQPQQVGAGERMLLPVTFTPRQTGLHSATLIVEANGAEVAIPLGGQGGRPCLVLSPAEVDFGTVDPGCRSARRKIEITNRCETLKTVGRLELQGPGTGDFTLEGPAVPFGVMPGTAVIVGATYHPDAPGIDAAAFVVAGEGAPLLGWLGGVGGTALTRTDAFTQGKARADIVWVIDDSRLGCFWDPLEQPEPGFPCTYMERVQARMVEKASSFLDVLDGSGIDAHVGSTGSSIYTAPEDPVRHGPYDGRLFPLDGSAPRVIHSGMPAATRASTFVHNLKIGRRMYPVAGSVLMAALRAVTPPLTEVSEDSRYLEENDGNLGFLRDDASLTLILVSLRDDAGGDYGFGVERDIDDFIRLFRAIKGPRRADAMVRAHVIVNAPHPGDERCLAGQFAPALVELAGRMGGLALNVCDEDWSANLKAIAERAVEVERCYPLSGLPAPGGGSTGDPDTWLVVTVSGAPVSLMDDAGVKRFRFDEVTNELCFAPASAPRPGEEVTASYALDCGL